MNMCVHGPAAGEVIAVSTTGFVAQSYQLNQSPAFGSLVVTHGPDGVQHYGICHATETGGIEPGRHPIAWGSAEDGETDIYLRQPQLAHVLRTTFSCVLVGYGGPDGPPVQRVPAQPPRVHERVWRADKLAVRAFFSDLTYLRFLLRAGLGNVEDLLAASIVHAYRANDCDRAFLIAAGRFVARLLAGDYERLTAVLELLTAAEG
jgi:hypothetical protein